jgi:ankyrin repeat protein
LKEVVGCWLVVGIANDIEALSFVLIITVCCAERETMMIRAKSEHVQRILEAAASGDLEYLKQAQVSDQDLKTARCNSGCTALHWAAGTNQVQVLEYLVHTRRVLDVNAAATKKSGGRTPLHYSCRNGCWEATLWLVEIGGASFNPPAKHGVTPFQLAIWQNQLAIVKWLVEEQGVDPTQVNDFACGAVHWLGICPSNRANLGGTKDDACSSSSSNSEDGSDLLPLACWLAEQPGIDFALRQRQGHTPLHKAAWGGHLALIHFLRSEHDLWDEHQDDAGNYAADLADMANTPKHAQIAEYLRDHCSRDRARSCERLQVPITATDTEIRKAYLKQARKLHPDKRQEDESSKEEFEFDELRKAYLHLTEHGGRGMQSNPAHSLHLMLQVSGVEEKNNDDDSNDDQEASFFKARLIAVLLEYGDMGLDLSNVKKKWNQVWPDKPFPEYQDATSGAKKGSLTQFLEAKAGDVVRIESDGKGSVRAYAIDCSQEKVAEAAQEENSLRLDAQERNYEVS